MEAKQTVLSEQGRRWRQREKLFPKAPLHPLGGILQNNPARFQLVADAVRGRPVAVLTGLRSLRNQLFNLRVKRRFLFL